MLHSKMTKMDYVVEFILQLIGIAICAVILYPILNMVAISLSGYAPVARGEVDLIPKDFSLEAYVTVLTNPKIIRAFCNSVYLAAACCVFRTFAVLLTAYPLACCDFPGKKIWNIVVLLPMWFSAGTVPTFLCMKELGLLNSYWALILGGLISSYNVLIATNFMRGIPKELVESARIDGAGEFRILVQIMMPLSKPLIATLAIWIISGTWNAYMGPAIYLQDSDMFTLQQVLRSIVLEADMASYDIALGDAATAIPDQIRYATLIFSMIPMLIMYPFAQKYFVKGVTVGAVKG